MSQIIDREDLRFSVSFNRVGSVYAVIGWLGSILCRPGGNSFLVKSRPKFDQEKKNMGKCTNKAQRLRWAYKQTPRSKLPP